MAATAQARPLDREQILDFLREHKAYCEAEYGVIVVGLFGSFARGEATAKSDVDVLFEYAESCPDAFLSQFNFKDFLQKKLRRKVDIANAKWLNRHMKSHILSTAIYV